MSDIKKGVFIRWTGADDDGGEASYAGQVTRVREGRITFRTSIGTMTVPQDDGEFKVTRKPKGWKAEPELAPTRLPKVRPAKPRKRRKARAKTGGKLPQVVALVREHNPATRKEAIALIVRELGMSDAGASTYYNMAKKEL